MRHVTGTDGHSRSLVIDVIVAIGRKNAQNGHFLDYF